MFKGDSPLLLTFGFQLSRDAYIENYFFNIIQNMSILGLKNKNAKRRLPY
jgi:hypothetical protein